VRIAIISRELPPHGGGIGSWSWKAGRGLARLGNEVHLFTEAHDGEPNQDLNSGVHIHRLRPARVRPHSVAWAWSAARAVAAAGKFDVVQACEWDAEAMVYALRPVSPLVTRLASPHYMVQASNVAPLRKRLRSAFTSRMERMQARRSRRVISPSLHLAREVAQRWRMDLDSISIVPTGIDPPQISTAPIPASLEGARYLLYFGRLEIRKGVDTLIDALPAVMAVDRDVHCVFIGEDMTYNGIPFVEYAKERCAEFWSRIHFLPRMAHPELFGIVANATLVVIPSRWENLANTCLESMVLGRAIIATTGSGFDEVLTNGVDGLLVPPGDSGKLAGAVTSALGDPALLERLGAAARLRASDFTVDGMARRLQRIYGELSA
jgi:glycosyltransferase involved in cell wall biosynthesis